MKWLEALKDVWDASVKKYGPLFTPDHLFPKLDGSGAILEPMSYAQTISHLRRYLSQIASLQSCTLEYTIHSAKATLLSWACQLHLDSESRSLQGHHKLSLNSSVKRFGSCSTSVTSQSTRPDHSWWISPIHSFASGCPESSGGTCSHALPSKPALSIVLDESASIQDSFH